MKASKLVKVMFFAIVLANVLSSCSYKITRTGYQIPEQNQSTSNCNVVFKKSLTNTKGLERIGHISLESTGFTTNCNERKALELLNEEACRINADIVNIYAENRPDFTSDCYRCQAEFFVIDDNNLRLKSDEIFSEENLRHRLRKDRTNIFFNNLMHFAIGFAIGFILI